jgi:hypothetical protein
MNLANFDVLLSAMWASLLAGWAYFGTKTRPPRYAALRIALFVFALLAFLHLEMTR